MSNIQNRMTDAQLSVLAKASSEVALAKFKEYIDLSREAARAIVQLPHTNERGVSVVHGCNKDMDFIAGQYRIIAEQYRWFLSAHSDLAEANLYEEKA